MRQSRERRGDSVEGTMRPIPRGRTTLQQGDYGRLHKYPDDIKHADRRMVAGQVGRISQKVDNTPMSYKSLSFI